MRNKSINEDIAMKPAISRFMVLLLGLAFALPAAARPTWSFVELDYLSSDRESENQEALGARFKTSISLERWLFFTGEYNHADYEDSDLQQRDTSIGFGIHSDGRNLQYYGAATYERSDLYTTDFTDEGYAMQFGLRWTPIRELEVAGDAKWYNMSRALNVVRHRGTLQWRLGPTWALLGTYQNTHQPGVSVVDWTVGFRAYFATQYDLPPRRQPDTR